MKQVTAGGGLGVVDASAWKRHLSSWKTYALASGASLAAGTGADADIVYSGILNKTATVNPVGNGSCLLYTSPSPRDGLLSRMPSSA